MIRSRTAPHEPTARDARPGLAGAAGSLLLAIAAPFAGTAGAAEFECSIPGDTRHLRLELPGEEHLCEVSVSYRQSGERRVMWYADNDSSFCSDRLDELRAKYEDEWGFECARWPDPSGVDALGPERRAALDEALRRRRAALAGDGARLVGVRVSDASLDGGAALDATEFFVRDARGEVRTELTLERDGRTVLETRDLAASLSTGDETVDGAWLDGIDADGALRVVTTLSSGASACRGEQALRAGRRRRSRGQHPAPLRVRGGRERRRGALSRPASASAPSVFRARPHRFGRERTDRPSGHRPDPSAADTSGLRRARPGRPARTRAGATTTTRTTRVDPCR